MEQTIPQPARRAGQAAPATPLPQRALGWLQWLAALALIIIVFYRGLAHVVGEWQRPEYSYGYVIWPLSAWLLWNRLCDLPRERLRDNWAGPPVVVLALVIGAVGNFSGMPALTYYGFVLCCYGLILGRVDSRGFLAVFAALSLLWFGYPLPSTLYTKVTVFLQLLSSQLGAASLRAFDIPVLLQGNVIDLGVYQLQVAEACSGLRYLFPIGVFGYIVAYTYRGPLWQKALIFLAAAPITIVINTFRIAVTGMLVKLAGIKMAEGFLHWFEGFVVALIGLGLLYVVVAVLGRLAARSAPENGGGGKARRNVWAHIRFELFWPLRRPPAWLFAGWSPPLVAALVLLTASAIAIAAIPERQVSAPPRLPLVTFPMQVGPWQGTEHALAQNYLAILRLDDYLIADYTRPGGTAPVELYIAYYKQQDSTAAMHSPGVCIPAGGWEISDFEQITIPGIRPGKGLSVNRAIIDKELNRRLVYYWFDQRGRDLTDEYAVKLTNALDAVILNRTDGALIRLVTPIVPLEPPGTADARLQTFLRKAYPLIRPYVPD